MWQTLIQLPHQWHGFPLFGWGWVLLLWGVIGAVILISASRASSFSQALHEWFPFVGLVALLIVFVLPAVEVRVRTADGSVVPDGIAIRGYGVMMGLAIAASVALAVYRAQRRGIGADVILGLGTWLVALGIAGGRLFYVLQYWQDFQHDNFLAMIGNALNLTRGGLVVYGALLGGCAAFVYYAWKHRLSYLSMADLVVPSLMLGLAIGRVGCFLNGCCYGGPTESAWGVQFPPESVPYVDHLRTGRMHGFRLANVNGNVVAADVVSGTAADRSGLPEGAKILSVNGLELNRQAARDALGLPDNQETDESVVAQLLIERSPTVVRLVTDRGTFTIRAGPLPARTEPIHPTQIYSAITAGLICLFLLTLEPFLPLNGYLFATWITVYPPARFLLEVIRTDEGSFAGTGLTISQNMSLVLSLLAIGFWVYLWRRKTDRLPKKAESAASAPSE